MAVRIASLSRGEMCASMTFTTLSRMAPRESGETLSSCVSARRAEMRDLSSEMVMGNVEC